MPLVRQCWATTHIRRQLILISKNDNSYQAITPNNQNSYQKIKIYIGNFIPNISSASYRSFTNYKIISRFHGKYQCKG